MFQGVHTASGAKETFAPSHRHVAGVRLRKQVGNSGKDSASKFGRRICLGFHRRHLWNTGNSGMGGLVFGRTEFASCLDSRPGHWLRSSSGEGNKGTISRLAQLGRRKRSHTASCGSRRNSLATKFLGEHLLPVTSLG